MNSVMRSYTPDFRTRLSTMETPLSAASLLNSNEQPLRRRYSITFGASVSLSINGNKMSAVVSNGTQTPPGTTAANLAKSKTETPVSRTQKAMSVHENLMMKILATPVDQPLSLDCSTPAEGVSPCSSLGSPGTPLSSEQLIESDDVLRCFTPPNGLDCHKDPRMARLYKDLRSPSATTRIRALRALKSPSKREAYGQFDVPHEQQDIITAEERENHKHKTIQEVMAGVCIYVEVRSGADNRSDGIKDHVASLGAKVNERLYKDTTHVIFKDGLLSTFQKAKKMNIPVVSILWIEACKRHMCLMNPEGYPISNLERYENPELFKKIRRQKSMQPRAEEGTNSAGKKKTPHPLPDANAKLSLSARLPVLHRLRNDDGLEKILNDFQAENASNTEPQDDFDRLLAGPMRLLEKFRNSPVAGMSTNQKPADKPTSCATSEAEKNISATATPEMPLKRTRKSLFNGHGEAHKSPTDTNSNRRRRSGVTKEVTPAKEPSTRQRRKTTLFTPRVTSVQEEQESPISSDNNKRNSSSKKRHTICTPKAMDLCKSKDTSKESENMPPPTSQKNRNTLYTPKTMEQEKADKTVRVDTGDDASRTTLGCAIVDTNSSHESAQHIKTPEMDAKDLEAFKTNRRRTLYTPGVYDEAGQNQAFHTPVLNKRRTTMFLPPANSTIADKTPAPNGSLRRRTLYTPSPAVSIPETPVVNRRRTMFTPAEQTVVEIHEPPKSITPTTMDHRKQQHKTLIEEYQSTLTFSSTKTPISERRRTIFDISMDIIDKRLSQINQLSKQSDTANGSSIATPTSLMLKSPPARPLSVPRQTSLDTFYRKLSKSTEKSTQFKTINIRKPTALTADDNTGPVVPRKRKLFNAQPTDGSPNGISPDCSAECPLSSDSNPSKKAKTTTPPTDTVPAAPAPAKRRSLSITQQHTKSASAAIGGATSLAKAGRRSSMFYQSTATTGRRAQPVIVPRPVMGTQARAMKKALGLPLGSGLPSVASQQENRAVTCSRPVQQKYHLATTNLHAEQHAFVKEVGLF